MHINLQIRDNMGTFRVLWFYYNLVQFNGPVKSMLFIEEPAKVTYINVRFSGSFNFHIRGCFDVLMSEKALYE